MKTRPCFFVMAALTSGALLAAPFTLAQGSSGGAGSATGGGSGSTSGSGVPGSASGTVAPGSTPGAITPGAAPGAAIAPGAAPGAAITPGETPGAAIAPGAGNGSMSGQTPSHFPERRNTPANGVRVPPLPNNATGGLNPAGTNNLPGTGGGMGSATNGGAYGNTNNIGGVPPVPGDETGNPGMTTNNPPGTGVIESRDSDSSKY